MNPSPKTIRLQNTTGANFSLNLRQMRAPASSRLRRGMLMTPIVIRAGLYYDMCVELGISFEEARAIVDQSPEIKAFQRGGRLQIIEWPPAATTSPEELSVPAPAPSAPEPAPPVQAPLVPESPPAPEPSAPDDSAEPALASEPESEDEVDASRILGSPGMLDKAPGPAPARAPEPPREPSMSWKDQELRDYAAAKDIDVSKCKSKTAVLRKIRAAGG